MYIAVCVSLSLLFITVLLKQFEIDKVIKYEVAAIQLAHSNLFVTISSLCVLSLHLAQQCWRTPMTHSYWEFREHLESRRLSCRSSCTVIRFWCEMSSSTLSLKSISSNSKFTANNNYSTTVVASLSLSFFFLNDVLLKSVHRLVERNDFWTPLRLSVHGVLLQQRVSSRIHLSRLLFTSSHLSRHAGKLRARCGLQLNSHWDTLKCKMAVTTKSNYSVFEYLWVAGS